MILTDVGMIQIIFVSLSTTTSMALLFLDWSSSPIILTIISCHGPFGASSGCSSVALFVMNQLDPIEELYNMYSEEEDTPRIVEVVDDELDFDSDVEGPADPYMDL